MRCALWREGKRLKLLGRSECRRCALGRETGHRGGEGKRRGGGLRALWIAGRRLACALESGEAACVRPGKRGGGVRALWIAWRRRACALESAETAAVTRRDMQTNSKRYELSLTEVADNFLVK